MNVKVVSMQPKDGKKDYIVRNLLLMTITKLVCASCFIVTNSKKWL